LNSISEEFSEVKSVLLLVDRDPVFSRIMKRFSEHPFFFSFICVVLFSIPSVVVGAIEGVLLNKSLQPDLIGDIGYWAFCFGAIPGLTIFSIMFYKKLPATFFELFKNDVLICDQEKYFDFNNKIYNVYNNNFLLFFIYLFALVLAVYLLLTFNLTATGSWHRPVAGEPVSLTNLVQIPSIFVAMYLTVQFTLRLIIGCFMLIFLFKKFDVEVKILHPDKCGGLGKIGEFSKTMNILVFLTGILVAMGVYSNISIFNKSILDPSNFLMITAFIIGAFMLVFSPIIAAHSKMEKARIIFIEELHIEFEKINKILRANLKNDKSLEEESFERLKRINEYYQISSEHPVWPFNAKVVFGFFAAISPVMVLTVDKVVSKFIH